MPEEINTLPRRKFFGNAGKMLAGFLLAASFPVKFLTRDKKGFPSRSKKIRIIEHPQAVKRNKKGYKG